jgi:iron complex outermembrane receptor protein
LRLAPGVEVAQIDGSTWSIGIRGFGTDLTRSVLVLIDGRTVYTPLFAGTNWDVQNTMMDDIDRIEVIRGPGGTIWGPNAVEWRHQHHYQELQRNQGRPGVGGRRKRRAGIPQRPLRRRQRPGLQLSRLWHGLYRSPNITPTGRILTIGAMSRAAFAWTGRKAGTLHTLQGDIYDEVAGKSVRPPAIRRPIRKSSMPTRCFPAEHPGPLEKSFRRGQRYPVAGLLRSHDRQTPNYSEIRNTFDVDFLQRASFAVAPGGFLGPGRACRPGGRSRGCLGAAVCSQPAHRLSADRLHSGSNRAGGPPSLADSRDESCCTPISPRRWPSNPARGCSGRRDEKQTVWAAYTHALRTPSDSEENFYLLGYIGTTPNGIPYFARFNPNPTSRRSSSTAMNSVTGGWLGKTFYVDLTGFYNHYHDLFSEDIAGATFLGNRSRTGAFLLPAQFRNGLLGYTKGAEIAPEWRPKDFWRLRGSYSFLHMNVGKSPHSGDMGPRLHRRLQSPASGDD